MKNQIKIIILLILISISYSCKDEIIDINMEESKSKLNIKEYYDIFKIRPEGGRILLQSNSSQGNNNYKSNKISCAKNRVNKQFHLIDNKTQIALEINNSNNTETGNLFGKEILYKINSDGYDKDGDEGVVYIPELLNVSISTNKLEVGSIITWNVDDLNANGLILWFEYSKLFNLSNQSLVNNYPNPIKGGLTIPDNIGSYTITENDLSIIPDGSFIVFHISRAGFDVSTTNTNNQIAFIGVTTVTEHMKVEK